MVSFLALLVIFQASWENSASSRAIQVTGHVFQRPSFGHVLTLDAKSDAFVGFSAREDAPDVGDSTPRLSKADALAVARRLLVDDPPQVYEVGRVKTWTSYTIDPDSVSPEMAKIVSAPVCLGWFVPEGARVARLTWKVPYWRNVHTVAAMGGTKGSLRALMIDAVTGEELPSKGLSGTL